MEHFTAKDKKQQIALSDGEVDQSAGADDDYMRAMQHALARLEKGFNLGGSHELDRDALHDRKTTRRADSH